MYDARNLTCHIVELTIAVIPVDGTITATDPCFSSLLERGDIRGFLALGLYL